MRRYAGVLLQLLVLAFIGVAFCVRAPHVLGLSMEPLLHPGEFVLIDTLAYRLGHVRRGEIIAFNHDRPTPQTFIKRVIGLPGERISIEAGRVSIDGVALVEGYVEFHDARSRPAVVVPPDSIYVLGDNRPQSDDSRDWGVVPASDVIGKAIATVWPPRRVGPP